MSSTNPDHTNWLSRQQLAGEEIMSLMREHKVTIKGLAELLQVPQKRVRHVRNLGVRGKGMVMDWYEAITRTGVFANMPARGNTVAYGGYAKVDGVTISVQFDAPAKATKAERDAAFFRELSKKVEFDYLEIGRFNK